MPPLYAPRPSARATQPVGLRAAPSAHGEAPQPCDDETPPRAAVPLLGCDRIWVPTPLAFHPERELPPPEIRRSLDAVAELLRAHPEVMLLRVEGYSSSRPAAEPRARRDEVVGSKLRAEAVFRYLHVYAGVSAERLDAMGYGFDAREARQVERWPIVLRVVHRGRDTSFGVSPPR